MFLLIRLQVPQKISKSMTHQAARQYVSGRQPEIENRIQSQARDLLRRRRLRGAGAWLSCFFAMTEFSLSLELCPRHRKGKGFGRRENYIQYNKTKGKTQAGIAAKSPASKGRAAKGCDSRKKDLFAPNFVENARNT